MANRAIALPSFFMFCACIAFLASSLASDYWVKSFPIDTDKNNSTREVALKSKGEINFGLFKGTEVLNFGFETNQVKSLHIVCDSKEGVCMYSDKETDETRLEDLRYNLVLRLGINDTEIRNPNLVSYGLWASTIAFIGLSLAAAAIGAIFCVVNSVMTPVEFITGIRGLYIWNGLGTLFSTSAMIVWAVTFHNSIIKNVLNRIHVEKGWSSNGRSSLGYSFWFIFASFIFFVSNIVLLLLLIYKPWVRRKPKNAETSNPGGVIMLY